MRQYYYNNFRIQVLNKDILRIEHSKKKKFLDETTFFIQNRNFDYDDGNFLETNDGLSILMDSYKIFIPSELDSLKGIIVYKSQNKIYETKLIKNSGELPEPFETGEIFALMDSPRVLLPKDGYSSTNKEEEPYIINKDGKDLYLFFINRDYRLLRKRYVELTGKTEMVRYSQLGLWSSRYYRYTQEEAQDMILNYQKHDIALDNMVIDTDWRKAGDRGIGYDINEELFPDMEGFFKFAHENNIEIMFNDHPEPVEGAKSCLSKKEIDYREEKLTDLMKLGLDTWWYDRNWHTKLISPVKGIERETFGLYLFNEITKKYYESVKKGQYPRRPVAMGNINNIKGGDYIKIHDSASHRYPLQWTGDISSEEGQIIEEIRSMTRCNQNEIAYFSSDIGGFIGSPEKDVYLKWIKYGAFSPIFRPHCICNATKFREPWNYDDETVEIFRNVTNTRQHLLPYIYGQCFRNYIEGEPICKSLAYNYANNFFTHYQKREYLLGDDVLVTTNAAKDRFLLENKHYVAPIEVEFFNNKELKGEPALRKTYKNFNFIEYETSVEKGINPFNFSLRLKTKIKMDKDCDLYTFSDDGVRVYIDGELVLDSWYDRSNTLEFVKSLEKDRVYDVYIEYYQSLHDARFELSYHIKNKDDSYVIYIPDDKYINLNTGEVLKPQMAARITPTSIKDIPLFVKAGSIIPLVKEEDSVIKQDYSNIVLDVYPSDYKTAKGFLYEDDRETTGYKDGKYNTTNFLGYYDDEYAIYYVIIEKMNVGYKEGEIKNRNVKLKIHLNDMVKNVSSVHINGEEVPFEKYDVDKDVLPFNVGDTAKDGRTVIVNFTLDTSKETTIKLQAGTDLEFEEVYDA